MIEKVFACPGYHASEMEGNKNWAVISINEPEGSDWDLKDGWFDVLRLRFHDLDNEKMKYVDKESLDFEIVLFDRNMAKQIIDWVKNIENKVKGILVHCNAGISRSPAVALFLCEKYGLESSKSWDLYNKLVYYLLKEEEKM